MSGYDIYGNMIVDCHCGAFIGGGRRNKVYKNRFYNCSVDVHVDNRGMNWQNADCKPVRDIYILINGPLTVDNCAFSSCILIENSGLLTLQTRILFQQMKDFFLALHTASKHLYLGTCKIAGHSSVSLFQLCTVCREIFDQIFRPWPHVLALPHLTAVEV